MRKSEEVIGGESEGNFKILYSVWEGGFGGRNTFDFLLDFLFVFTFAEWEWGWDGVDIGWRAPLLCHG